MKCFSFLSTHLLSSHQSSTSFFLFFYFFFILGLFFNSFLPHPARPQMPFISSSFCHCICFSSSILHPSTPPPTLNHLSAVSCPDIVYYISSFILSFFLFFLLFFFSFYSFHFFIPLFFSSSILPFFFTSYFLFSFHSFSFLSNYARYKVVCSQYFSSSHSSLFLSSFCFYSSFHSSLFLSLLFASTPLPLSTTLTTVPCCL